MNMHIVERKLESILHMVVNYGESKSYKQDLPQEINMLAEYMEMDLGTCKQYLKAKLTCEVLEHVEEYTQFQDGNKMEIVRELIADFHNTVDKH